MVEPIAKAAIEAAGATDRVTTASGDFLTDPLPEADVITMSMILHDWNLERSCTSSKPPTTLCLPAVS